jgi:hypothetical protein
MPNLDYFNYPQGIVFNADGTYTMRVNAQVCPYSDPVPVGSYASVGWHIQLPAGCHHILIDAGLILIRKISIDGEAIPTEPALVNADLVLWAGLRPVFAYPYQVPTGADARVCFADVGFTLDVPVAPGEELFQAEWNYENQHVALEMELYASGTWSA